MSDEFDIYLKSTGSLDVHNLLPEAPDLDGDWRVTFAEIIFPSSIQNITTTDYMI